MTAYLASADFNELSLNDQRNRRQQLDWLLQWCGDLPLQDLSRGDILEWLDGLTNGETPSGRPASAGTRNRYLAAASKALSFGVEREWLRFNPAAGISRLREQARIRYLSRSQDVEPGVEPELPRFLAAVRESRDPRLYPAVLIMLSTACRRAELFEHPDGTHTIPALWQDLTLTAHDGTARLLIRRAKSGNPKALVLSGGTAAALCEYARVQPIDRGTRLFDRGGHCLWPRKEFEAALRRAEIEDFRPHDLCHTAISYMVMAGRSLAEVAEATDRTFAIIQRYAHLSPAHAAGVSASAQRFLDAAV